MSNKIQFEHKRKNKKEMKHFFLYDLNRLEYHTNELIDNIYSSGKDDIFRYDIDFIDNFFDYWKRYCK